MRNAFSILLIFGICSLRAQLPPKTLEGGVSYLNFVAPVLKNSTNSNSKNGKSIFLAYTAPVGPKSEFVYRLSVGSLLNLGEPFRSYSSGTFTRFDIEFRQSILSKMWKESGFKTFASLGYGFSYIPVHKEQGLKQVSTVVSSGLRLQYTPKESSVSVGLQASWNQRLNNDYRTFMQFQPTLVFEL